MAAATENLLLATANLGLGATWCGLIGDREAGVHSVAGLPDAGVHSVAGLPDDVFGFALIPIGVPAEEQPARTQYDESRIHWETYTD